MHLSFCASEISEEAGQGYCQGGFSADFTMVRVIFLIEATQVSGIIILFPLKSFTGVVFQDGKVVLGGPGSYFWQGMQDLQPSVNHKKKS